MQRRAFIVTAGATATVALAGCLGDDDTDDPESVVTAWYELVADVENPEEFLDGVADIAHSESPVVELFEEFANSEEVEQDEFEERTLESVETEILAEDLGVDALEAEFDLQSFWDVDEELLEEIAEENAHVSAEAEFDDGTESDAFLTATEGGDWVIFA